MNIALPLSFISAALTFFIVSQPHQGDFPSKGELLAFVLFWPNLLISLACLACSVSVLFDKNRSKWKALLVVCLSLVMPTRGGFEACYPKVKRDADKMAAYEAKLSEWSDLGARVNPLLREYHLANKSKCIFPHNDNEADVAGFEKFAASQGVALRNGRITDPWKDPVHFVIAHDGDRAFKACGQFYGIADQQPGIVAVGLLLGKPSNVDTALGRQWALKNGYLPTHPFGVH